MIPPLDSSCTCVAGKAGFCKHISALMLKICKFSLFEAKTTKDLCQEKDENPELACTSQLQKWHKKGGDENIVPQPVMDVYVTKTKLDEPSSSRGSGGVKCLLYEARKQPHYVPTNEVSFKVNLPLLTQTWVLLICINATILLEQHRQNMEKLLLVQL